MAAAGRAFGVVEQVDQRLDVIAAEHGAEQFRGMHPGDERGLGLALGDGGQESGLDVGRLVHARGDPVGDQINQEGFLALGRVFEQFDQVSGLLRSQRQRGNAHSGAFGGLLAIGFEHGENPFDSVMVWLRWIPATRGKSTEIIRATGRNRVVPALTRRGYKNPAGQGRVKVERIRLLRSVLPSQESSAPGTTRRYRV